MRALHRFMLVAAVALVGPVDILAQQRVTETELVDEDYRFAFRAPDAKWKPLGEDEIQEMMPGAVATLTYELENGAAGFHLYVERLPEEGFRNAFVSSIDPKTGFERVHAGDVVATRIGGRQGLFCEQVLSTNGMRLRFLSWGVERSGYIFRFILTVPQAVDRTLLPVDEFLAAIEWLPGKIEPRTEVYRPTDARGVGWILEDDVFRSVLSGYRIAPHPDWRLVVGAELDTYGLGAHVGIEHVEEGTFVGILVEPRPVGDPGVQVDEARERFRLQVGNPPVEDERKLLVGTQTVAFDRMEIPDSPPVRVLHGTWVQAEQLISALVFLPAGPKGRGVSRVGEALAAFEEMGDGDVRALESRLKALGDPRSRTGSDHSFRRDTYRDFAHSFRWTKPEEGLWTVVTGSELAAIAPQARLYARELRTGVEMFVIPEVLARRVDGSRRHDAEIAARESVLGSVERSPTTAVALGEAAGLSPTLYGDLEGRVQSLRIVTTVLRGSAFIVNLIHPGTPGETASEMTDRALARLEVLEDTMTPVESGPGRLVDHRLGYAVSGPATWSIEAIESPMGDTILSGVSIDAPSGSMVFLAVNSVGVVTLQWLMDNVLRSFMRDLVLPELEEDGERAAVRFVGLDGTRLTWAIADGRVCEAQMATAGLDSYLSLALGAPSIVAEFRDSVRLLP